MNTYYTDDKTTQILLSLLKSHGIKKVVVSPGTTNIALVGSMQYDPFFEIYSSVDERSAAYIACGLSYESGEPVVITCTEATASRDYFPGLTEAYYRKLPILAITGTHGNRYVGHLRPQLIDRSKSPVDTVRMSINIDKCYNRVDEWNVNVKVNTAILELTRNGGGPVHINLAFTCDSFETKQLPEQRVIKRFTMFDKLPQLPDGRIIIFIGSHKIMTDGEVKAIDAFCANHNSVVVCDKTSGYDGQFKIEYALISAQLNYTPKTASCDLLIHIGEVSGDTYTQGKLKSKTTWRISEDGEVRDTFKNLKSVFAMSEEQFFSYYADKNINPNNEFFNECQKEYDLINSKLPDIPFSNIWIAQMISKVLPTGAYLHLGIYNSLRSWNFVKIPNKINSICNVGGFGIDGALSTFVGASLAKTNVLHFAVIGDLAFFYDMNSLGNRHIGNNLRVLLVNNGKGTEFRKLDHPCAKFGDNADPFMAAAGHFGNKSMTLVKNYVTELGFEYLSASSKEEFMNVYKKFISPKMTSHSIVFEVFTDSENESIAVDVYRHVIKDNTTILKNKAKNIVKSIIK